MLHATYAARPPDLIGVGGTTQQRQLQEWPALKGLGLSQTYMKLAPCALMQAHTTPRGSAIMFVITGTRVVARFVAEDASHQVSNELSTGGAAIFPQGLIHYQQNLGCDVAELLITYNSEDPGNQMTLASLMLTSSNATNPEPLVTPVFLGMSSMECITRCQLIPGATPSPSTSNAPSGAPTQASASISASIAGTPMGSPDDADSEPRSGDLSRGSSE
eukprot:jgi/Botrbrau1/4759/Bobra.0137s0031.1